MGPKNPTSDPGEPMDPPPEAEHRDPPRPTLTPNYLATS